MTKSANTTKYVHFRTRRELVVDWVSHWLFRFVLWLLLRLPWRPRLACGAVFTSRILAPLAGWPSRIEGNLNKILPDLSKSEVKRLQREVPENFGRTFVEMFSPDALTERVKSEDLTGPGVPALEEAKRQERPALLVTGHIGNFVAIRAALLMRGYPVAGLYKPMANRYFNEHYVRAIEKIGKPLFPKDRSGMAGMLKFLRKGGMLGIVIDQHIHGGAPLNFMGEPAATALSAAEMALKFDALLIPVYAIRRSDLGFDLIIGEEIKHGSAEEMTQALNDDLEAQVRAHPEQWIWMHRRWRPLPKPADTS